MEKEENYVSIPVKEYEELLEYRNHKDIDIEYVKYFADSILKILRMTKEYYCGTFDLLTPKRSRVILKDFEQKLEDCCTGDDFADDLYEIFIEKKKKNSV